MAAKNRFGGSKKKQSPAERQTSEAEENKSSQMRYPMESSSHAR